MLLNQGTVMDLPDLKDNFNLQNQDHFRYLQIRDFVGKTFSFSKDDTTMGKEILDVFQKAYEDATYQTSNIYIICCS